MIENWNNTWKKFLNRLMQKIMNRGKFGKREDSTSFPGFQRLTFTNWKFLQLLYVNPFLYSDYHNNAV